MALLLQSATITVNVTDIERTRAVLEAEDAARAAKVEQQLKVFQQAGKDTVENVRTVLGQGRGQFRNRQEEMVLEMMSLYEKLLDAMTWTRNGAQVTITLKGSKGLMGEAFAKLVYAGATQMPLGRAIEENPAPRVGPPPGESRPGEKR